MDLLDKLRGMLPDMLPALKSIGRQKYFRDVVKSIVDRKLNIHNITLHLLLDLGQFGETRSSGTEKQIRHPSTTQALS